MRYWILKSEPDAYSWQQMQQDGITSWDGVRNYQARNNIRRMNPGDLGFFYHSNLERAIVGIVQIASLPYPDKSNPNFTAIDVKFHSQIKHPLTLTAIKADQKLANLPLIKQSRLSVMEITEKDWKYIISLTSF
jgi:predicted RNA-binding protein with PUA-like domain